MKHRVTLFFFVIISLIFISCPLQSPQVIPEGFHFDEAKFQEAKQKWQNATLENYSFEYYISFGHNKVSPSIYLIKGGATVVDGIPHEDYYELNGSSYRDEYHPDYGYHIGTRFNEEVQKVEEIYQITSCAFMTFDDVFNFIEERAALAKNRYANGKCSYYKMDIAYDYENAEYGVLFYFSEDYIFAGKKKIDAIETVNMKIRDFVIGNESGGSLNL